MQELSESNLFKNPNDELAFQWIYAGIEMLINNLQAKGICPKNDIILNNVESELKELMTKLRKGEGTAEDWSNVAELKRVQQSLVSPELNVADDIVTVLYTLQDIQRYGKIIQ